MLRFPALCFALLLGLSAFGQPDAVRSASRLKPAEPFDNIHVQKLFSDAKTSSFVIWVKEKVRLHKHAVHSETVYVLKGRGRMVVGDAHFSIRKGDVVFIPEGTPHAVTVTGGTLKVLSVQAPEFKGEDRIFLDE